MVCSQSGSRFLCVYDGGEAAILTKKRDARLDVLFRGKCGTQIL